MEKKCLFCGKKCNVEIFNTGHNQFEYNCEICGLYVIDDRDDFNLTDEEKFKLACILNEKRLKGFHCIGISGTKLNTTSNSPIPIVWVEDLLAQFPSTVKDLCDRTLLNLSRIPKFSFAKISIKHGVFQFYSFLENYKILQEFSERNFIKYSSDGMFYNLIIKLKGWENIESLEVSSDSKQAFVAMWFGDEMTDYYNSGMKLAIEDCEYAPMRIDGKEHNAKICDEIVAEIRQSKFLIADFTGQRGGVYFEAGFAMGLGIEVIFTIKEDELANVHFDTRQYNHIVYNSPQDLREKLRNRIRATII